MSDPLDDALKAVAHAEASRGFAAQVRARIEAGEEVPVARWPRVASACAAVVLVAALVWWVREDAASRHQVAVTVAPAGDVRPQAPAPRLEPRTQRLHSTGSTAVVGGAQSVARVRATRPTTIDHERALPPLPLLDVLSVPSIAPDALVLGEQVVTPLAPIAPISASHGEARDDERGKL